MPRAVLALPCGSRSMTSTVLPAWASAAATLTVVVVLPTPPFWFATVMTRVCAGRGTVRPLRVIRFRASAATAAASGVCASAPGIAAAIWARTSVSSWVVASMRSSRVPAGVSGVVCSLGAGAGVAGSVISFVGVAGGAEGAGGSGGAAGVDVSRETRSGAGHPRGAVDRPDSCGKPRPGAAVRISATSIAELTPSPSSWSRGDANPTSPWVNTPKRHGARWTTPRRTVPVDDQGLSQTDDSPRERLHEPDGHSARGHGGRSSGAPPSSRGRAHRCSALPSSADTWSAGNVSRETRADCRSRTGCADRDALSSG